MTDNEIIKALECCIKIDCEKCDFKTRFKTATNCRNDLLGHCLDLINRQKAENSNLTSHLTSLQNDLTSAKAEIERLKKCVAILKDEVGKRERGYDPSEEIDNLLKETVGEDK